MAKNLSSNVGDLGLIPGWGTKIRHAVGQLSLPAATPEPAYHSQDPTQPKVKIELCLNLLLCPFIPFPTQTSNIF